MNKSKTTNFHPKWLKNAFFVAVLSASHLVTADNMIIEESTSVIKLNGNTLFVQQDKENFHIQSIKGNHLHISVLKSDPKLRSADVIRVEINNSVEEYYINDIDEGNVFAKKSTEQAYQVLVGTDIGEFLVLGEDSFIDIFRMINYTPTYDDGFVAYSIIS